MSRMRLLRVAFSSIVLIAASALTARVSLADSVTLNASADAYFIPGNATNFGASPTILVGPGASLGLVQFDLSSLSGVPAASVTSATFSLWVTTVNTAGTVNVDTVSEATPWTELTVNGCGHRGIGIDNGFVHHCGCNERRPGMADYAA